MGKPRKKTGYKNPPVEHQFKKGQSGNPRGRPKNSRNVATILREAIQKKVGINIDGDARRVSVLEAVIYRLVENGLKGTPKENLQFLQAVERVLPEIGEPESKLPNKIRLEYVASDNAGGEFVATKEERDFLLARRKKKAAAAEAAKKTRDVDDDYGDPDFLN